MTEYLLIYLPYEPSLHLQLVSALRYVSSRRAQPGSLPEARERLPPSLPSSVAVMAEQPSAPPPLSRMARGLFSLWFRLFVYVVESEAAGETSRLSVRGSPGPREGPGGTGHSPEGRTAVESNDALPLAMRMET